MVKEVVWGLNSISVLYSLLFSTVSLLYWLCRVLHEVMQCSYSIGTGRSRSDLFYGGMVRL